MCRLCLWVTSVLAALAVGACGPRPMLPVAPAGVPLQPGIYVRESYLAPGFKPDENPTSWAASR